MMKTSTLQEPSLHSAVLLEQAACCYLLSSPRMLRKYGFHLILAGNSYYLSDQVCINSSTAVTFSNFTEVRLNNWHSSFTMQKQHAVRAYKNAMFVYKQNPWSYINNHVHFNVGRYLWGWSYAHFILICKLSLIFVWIRWYGVLGIFDVAIKHLLEVIACSHQSLTTQNMFLNDFFHFVQVIDQPGYDLHPLYQTSVANFVFLLSIEYRGKIRRIQASTSCFQHVITQSCIWRSSHLRIQFRCNVITTIACAFNCPPLHFRTNQRLNMWCFSFFIF
jgi:hypothetical protein